MAKTHRFYHRDISFYNLYFRNHESVHIITCFYDMSASNPFKDLESNDSQIVDEFKCRYKEQFNASMCVSYSLTNFCTHQWKMMTYVECSAAKETWVLNLIYDYYLATDSLRAVDVIVAIKEPHDKYFFDRLVLFPNYRQNPYVNSSTLM